MSPHAIAVKLRDIELLFEQLYLECTKLFPQHSSDFAQLALEEREHADALEKIIDIIDKEPDRCRCGVVTSKTLKLISNDIKKLLKEIREGQVAPRYLITRLRGFEQTMIERSVDKILIFDDDRCVPLINIVKDGFDAHLAFLQKLEITIFPKSDKEKLFEI